jgi:FkbM family methyltransferase
MYVSVQGMQAVSVLSCFFDQRRPIGLALTRFAVQDAIVRRLKPGATFWDIGAHIGFYSLLASRLVGSTGTVVAFEPEPNNAARLRRSIALNESVNIVVKQIAIAGQIGSTDLFPQNGESAESTIVAEYGQGVPVKVECTTLDSLIGERAPDLVKIDVEHAELELLHTGRRFVEAHRPDLIVEFLSDEELDQGNALLPDYDFCRLTEKDWFLRHRGARDARRTLPSGR